MGTTLDVVLRVVAAPPAGVTAVDATDQLAATLGVLGARDATVGPVEGGLLLAELRHAGGTADAGMDLLASAWFLAFEGAELRAGASASWPCGLPAGPTAP
jgi:hypothetical protein